MKEVKILQKRGVRAPVPEEIEVGEVAINTADGELYVKTDGGEVVTVGGGDGGGGSGSGFLYYPEEYQIGDTQGGYKIEKFWAHESEDLRLDLTPPDINEFTQLHAFGRINADRLQGDRLSILGNSLSLRNDPYGNKPRLSVTGPGTMTRVNALEATIFGGINIPAADEERPDEFPYSEDEKSVQYALTVSHETLGRTVEIDKEGIIRARSFTDMDGNPIGGGGDVDLSDYYTKTESDGKFQVKGNYLTEFTEEDPTVPSYVKSISQADIDKWNNPPTGGGGGAVDSVNGKTGTVVLNYTDVGAQQAGSYAASNHNHNGVYQPAGSYAASNHNHSGVYAPASHTHNYAAVGASYTKSESDGKYALKGSGGDDPNAVKLTGNQTVMGVKKFLGGSTYFQNLFIEGVPAGGVGFAGQSRIEFSSGATTLYGSSNTLQVNSAGTSITGGIICTGVITGTDCVASSDERLKDNITTAPVGLIESLQGREWEWKESGEKGSGVVAQELEKVLPHLVHEDSEGMKSVSYNGLVAYLIEEVKALKAEVETIRNG